MYVIGPTQVGKSTAIRRLVDQSPEIVLVDLDDELKPLMVETERDLIDLAQDWRVVGPILNRYEAPDGPTRIVVIGAGTQDMKRAGNSEFEQWLGQRRNRVVLVTADPCEVFERFQGSRGFKEFVWFEFQSRRSLYALAAITVDVSHLSPETAIRQVMREVRANLERTRLGSVPLNRP